MRRLVFSLMVCVSPIAFPACAADAPQQVTPAALARPAVGAPAPWVLPASIPAPPPAAQGEAVMVLMGDLQARFSREGTSYYVAHSFKIATSAGLESGALEISWDPALETLTLHRYRILRDGKEINLLGDGGKLSVIQREKNMESAVLNGELTTSLQPEDLRVGDIVDIAYTRTRHDPAMKGMSEAMLGPNDGVAFGRNRLRLIWPNSKLMKWRAFPGAIQPKLTHTDLGNELISDLDNVTTPKPPENAPSRFQLINYVEITEFKSWSDVSKTFAPLYDEAVKLGAGSPVKALAVEISAATADPKIRAERALKLVQEQVRYLYLGMNDGGYVPASADTTWSRRFGDCKAKTVLLTALLRELGIDAHPLLVNTERGDTVAVQLPIMGAFDHAIVEARIGGHSYWLDGTRLADTTIDKIETPAWHVGLPIVSGGAELVPLVPAQLSQPSETISLDLDASAGVDVPASAKGEMRYRGQSGTDMRVKYSGMSPADLDAALRKQWHDTYDFVTPTTVSTSDDSKTGDFLIQMAGSAKMDWGAQSGTRWYELDRARLGWKFNITRDKEINLDAPYSFDYPSFWENRETIKLPNGGKGFKLQGGPVDQTVEGLYEFHRELGINADVVTMENRTRALTDELPAKKAQAAHDAMMALGDVGIFIRLPDDYRKTDLEIAALGGDKPAQGSAYMMRGAQRSDAGDHQGALADENAALALAPNLAPAHAVRALQLAIAKSPEALAAADRALALDPKQSLAWRAKGIVAFNAKQYDDAIKDYGTAIDLGAKDAEILTGRGGLYLLKARFAEALADFDAALAVSPSALTRGVRATALYGLGRNEEALTEADEALKSLPDSDKLHTLRAALNLALDHHDKAIADYNWLIDHKPSATLYLQRAQAWPIGDKEHINADIEAALKLDPRDVRALAIRASQETDSKQFAQAEKDIASADAISPDNIGLAMLRTQLLQSEGRVPEAIANADHIIAKHPANSALLNSRCWLKAIANVQLDSALADCDAAVKLTPTSAAILDSRAFVLFRMGRNDDAVVQYSAALKIAPRQSGSLFGRGLARDRLGDHAEARTDIAEAREITADIDAKFRGYGIKIPDDFLAPQALH